VEVSHPTPTLTQPSVTPLKAAAFVPFSIESESWSGLREELSSEFVDAKDQLEASKFTLGTGSPEPQGISVGATYLATTAGTAAFVVGDVYTLSELLPPRYQPKAQYVGSKTILDKVRRFVGSGNTTEMPVYVDGAPPSILGRQAYELSAMSASVSSTEKILALGDFSRFMIVDRLGLQIEIVPHLFHTSNNRPSGMRGLYAYWFTTSYVRDVNAFRQLKVR
jgi:HK97 family phage major capsid protein